MNIANIKKENLIFIIASVVVGFLIIRQIAIVVQYNNVVNEDNAMKLSYEIIETSNSNFQLQDELNQLNLKNNSFSSDVKDKAKVKDDLDSKIKNYQDLNGINPLTGRGVEIAVDGSMVTEEMVDLMNGVRNTKPEAIGINGKRIIYRSYFIVGDDGKLEVDGKKFSFPFTVQVMGDSAALKEALNRSGGILDVLKSQSFDKIKFAITEKDKIDLPAYDGKINFKYAKTVSY